MSVEIVDAHPHTFRGVAANVGAGLWGGVGVSIVGHPLDTLKLKLQTGMYKSMGEAFRGTWKNEGAKGLYAAVELPILANTVLFALFHGINEYLPSGSTNYFVSGALTGAIAAFVESPINLVMNQVQGRPGSTTIGRFNAILKSSGPVGLYQGFGACMIRNIPCNALYLGAFQTLKDDYKIHPFFAGCVGGLAYWVFTYPLDVIRGCMMADSPDKSKRMYKSWSHCVRTLYATGGMGAFFRGYTPCILRAVPANGAFFLMAEQARRALGATP